MWKSGRTNKILYLHEIFDAKPSSAQTAKRALDGDLVAHEPAADAAVIASVLGRSNLGEK